MYIVLVMMNASTPYLLSIPPIVIPLSCLLPLYNQKGRNDEQLPEAVIGCSVNKFVPVLSAIDHESVFSPLRASDTDDVNNNIDSDGMSNTLRVTLESKFGSTVRYHGTTPILTLDLPMRSVLHDYSSDYVSNISF